MAGGKHDRRDSEAGRTGGSAPEASPDRAVHRTAAACRGVEPSVVRRLQGLVPHRRRDAHRSADHQRCVEPVSAALAGGGEGRQRVGAIFEAAFREYGLPAAIRTDNGAPFASPALGGLSRLAVWWMRLGIVPERIAAGHPEQNGRHERMHRTLKQDLGQAKDRWAQQRELDRFRREYNEVRPHEALSMQTPASLYVPSPRAYPSRLPQVQYPDTMQVRMVKSHGHFRWKMHDVFLSEVLWGEPIGLLPVNDRHFTVYFAHLPLARFDSRTCTLSPLCSGNGHKNKNLPKKEKLSGM